MIVRYQVGDIVKMKKTHPCGSDRWEVLRTGIDFRIKCLGCGRQVMLPRPKFEKAVKAIIQPAAGGESSCPTSS
ncbi:DUF951 domain-containing protein [Sporolituus thermophilus]|uniref:DUF951 domain-containing protein n=1 Tax=Sporolituus thermophilus DSM 23256 TaxID=1123285 RepID=A0A1G7L2N8_9FIRM|nr:DUF951 domain-containing protein [Sporolituus thermophilus]SDF43279.1 hypothetical protein SAMN05660235_01586 [Sporolituus thermophilus DSM 23256]